MSGGSHNYLSSRAPDEISELAQDIERMCQHILRSGFPMVACHEGPVDLDLHTGLCRPCWRVFVLAFAHPAWREEP